jgi:undecaprenyl-diphosphatase
MKRASIAIYRYYKKLPLAFLLLLFIFACAIFLFVWITHEVLAEKEEAVDNYIFNFLSSHLINPGLTSFMIGVTYFASAAFLEIAYIVTILGYILARSYTRAIEIFAIGLGGFLVNYFMKLAFHRERPPHSLIGPVKQFSFPSGHATAGFIFYGLLVYLIWNSSIPRRYKLITAILLLLFSLLIGFSRIYLRVHYTSDVVAGFCIGGSWLLLMVWLFEKFKKRAPGENEIR